WTLVLVLHWLLMAACLADEPVHEVQQTIRLRLEWGGGRPQKWSGLLEISEGRFSNPVSLGVEADEPGTIWIDDDAVR
ncbi:MAG: hypothetical protein IH820_17290, partial [Bacteroidetes bacterium]|nr:hypothetical protein [Bacteroidota bacterium]